MCGPKTEQTNKMTDETRKMAERVGAHVLLTKEPGLISGTIWSHPYPYPVYFWGKVLSSELGVIPKHLICFSPKTK